MGRGALLFCICLTGIFSARSERALAADWKTTQLPGVAGEMFLLNVSCPTASFCVATGTQNLIASSTDPTGGPGAWHTVFAGEGRYESPSGPVISSRQVQGVSCPSTRLCVAVTTLGQIYSSTDPTGPASAWDVAEISASGRNTHLYGVSCPTESLCVAVSGRRVNRGKVFTSTDPSGGASTWREVDLGEQFDLRAVSCATPTQCVAAGAQGELVVTRNPTGSAADWFAVGSPGGPGTLQAVSCLPGICLTGNSGGNLLTATDPTSLASWKETNGGGSVQITGSSCASPSACLAADNNGDVIVSTNPGAARPDWSSTNLRPYASSVEMPGSADANGLFGASCPTVGFCALVGSRGAILTSANPFAPSAQDRPGSGRKPRRPHKRKRPRVHIARLDFRVSPRGRATIPRHAELRMRFYARGAVRRFECRLDRGRFRRCRSPARFRGIGRGVHSVTVRAVGFGGVRSSRAVKRFFVGRHCVRSSCFVGAGEIRSSAGAAGR
ncbi:MAG TPA: hypothetical protein VFJ99_00945 [Solirubrobacterales bacterium]|nr:hypothetical protein [Solirubrobacterales bacterium]